MQYFINAYFASEFAGALFKRALFVSGVQNCVVHFYNSI